MTRQRVFARVVPSYSGNFVANEILLFFFSPLLAMFHSSDDEWSTDGSDDGRHQAFAGALTPTRIKTALAASPKAIKEMQVAQRRRRSSCRLWRPPNSPRKRPTDYDRLLGLSLRTGAQLNEIS